jgi:hypothetical protein
MIVEVTPGRFWTQASETAATVLPNSFAIFCNVLPGCRSNQALFSISGSIVAPVADGWVGHDHLVSVVWVQNVERRTRIAVSFSSREYPASIRVVSSKDLDGGGLRHFLVHLESLDQNQSIRITLQNNKPARPSRTDSFPQQRS